MLPDLLLEWQGLALSLQIDTFWTTGESIVVAIAKEEIGLFEGEVVPPPPTFSLLATRIPVVQ